MVEDITREQPAPPPPRPTSEAPTAARPDLPPPPGAGGPYGRFGSGGPYGTLPPPPSGTLPRRPPRRSVLWVVLGSLVGLVLLAATTFQIVDVLAHGEHDVEWVIEEPVATLVVDHTGDGKVHVVGAPVERVTVRGHVSDGLRHTAYGHRLVGDRLEVTATCPNIGGVWCSVDYVIEVPHDTVVQIHNDDGTRVEDITADVEVRSSGSIEVSGLSGLVLLDSQNGSVRATGMRSAVVEAGSDNGSVRVTSEIPPRSIIAKSDNGSVEVLVPRTDDRYSVDVDTRFGSRSVEVDVDPQSDRRLTARSSNGSVRVGYSGA